ncbi:MAG TPA: 50S ribosomal protein L32 [Aggregatilineales bacterium]|nr:50S ribosomal protein L32 [Aggregatilineales bacterium]
MGPLPKRKISRRRKRARRSHDSLTLRHLVRCENCEAFKPAHEVCPECGEYNGHTVFELQEEE